MPYIHPQDRPALDLFLDGIAIETPGELNYCLTRLVLLYLSQRQENYQAYNDVMGALEGAKLELYRRRVAPYEDDKIRVNGDV